VCTKLLAKHTKNVIIFVKILALIFLRAVFETYDFRLSVMVDFYQNTLKIPEFSEKKSVTNVASSENSC
jgi:hypothetical protein